MLSSHASRSIAEPPPPIAGDHPCFAASARAACGRIHLPVAPRCNVQCNYCDRRVDCVNESRPGVTSRVLTPEQALERVRSVVARLAGITVVGIAGPGDPLANPERTFDTLSAVRREFPNLRGCLSTNGLALPAYVDRILDVGVRHVTVTVNAVDPAIGALIYARVHAEDGTCRGREGAELLMSRQLQGIEALARSGVRVKVNSVLIPTVNDSHLPAVAREVARRGAILFNVIPLIPVAGTAFGALGTASPAEVQSVRAECARTLPIMRHCARCRADAIGLLGRDRSAEFSADVPGPCRAPCAAARRSELVGLRHAPGS